MNHSQAQAPKADGSAVKKLAPLVAVAVAGIFLGAAAVGVSQQFAGGVKAPAPTAETAAVATPAQREAQVAAFAAKQGLTVKAKFGVGNGIDVVSYTKNEGMAGGVFYHLADGTFVAGQMFDPAGSLLTEAHFKQAWPDGPPTPESVADLPAAIKALETAAMTTVKKEGPELYMIYEPHCGFCKQSHTALKDLNVTVHYLPVAFLSQDSEALAAAMLKGGPGIMDRVNNNGELPKLAAEYASQAESVRPQLEHNAQVMRLAGASGTPVFLWKNKSGTGGVQRGAVDAAGMQRMLAQIAADQGLAVASTDGPKPAN